MSHSAATESEWRGNYQISEQGAENRRSGSGRHRSNHHRSSGQPQQPQGYPVDPRQQMPQQQQQRRSGKYPAGGQYPGQYSQHQQQMQAPVAPTTGPPARATEYREMRSGHLEVDSLYGSGSGQSLTVNSMNAPNNSTMQCGCENIDCPFCNLMMSVQMSS